MTRLTALWLTAAGLLAVLAWEISGSPQEDVVPARSPATAVTAPPEPGEISTREWVATVLARPLFSPDRRPAVATATAGAGLSGLPRLTGIMVGPFGRSAIFAADSHKPIIVQEGARIAAYTVKTIDAAEVRVVGPDGMRVLHPAFEPAATGDQAVLAPQRRIGQAALPR